MEKIKAENILCGKSAWVILMGGSSCILMKVNRLQQTDVEKKEYGKQIARDQLL